MQTDIKQGAAIGGWVCFALAVTTMIVAVPAFFIYLPLFVASFVLSIVAMAQRRIAAGVTLLLANVIGGPVLFFVAFTVNVIVWSNALAKADKGAPGSLIAATTNRTSDVSPVAKLSDPQTAESTAPSALPAVEKIEGAFGKKLGDIFDPAQAVGTSKLTDGTPMYEFATPTGFRSFKRYYVMVTPTTHKIYSIWGIGSAENTQAGEKEQAVIMELLKEKYGPTEKAGLFDTMGDIKRITHGDRYVITKITGFTDVTLEIRYYDGKLEKLAENERLASEVQKADKTGL